MILASAIKFHIEATDKDVILCGCRHGDVFMQLPALGFKPHEGYKEIEQGFIDNNGNFLTREQAFEHAKQCGQISSKIAYERDHGEGVGGKRMISEDLW